MRSRGPWCGRVKVRQLPRPLQETVCLVLSYSEYLVVGVFFCVAGGLGFIRSGDHANSVQYHGESPRDRPPTVKDWIRRNAATTAACRLSCKVIAANLAATFGSCDAGAFVRVRRKAWCGRRLSLDNLTNSASTGSPSSQTVPLRSR